MIFAAILAAFPAYGQMYCGERKAIADHLSKEYHESQIAAGITKRGGLVEVWSTADGKTWTLFITTPDGQSCLLSSGLLWEVMNDKGPTY